MGFKSTNNLLKNTCKPFKINGLIFDSEEDFKMLKNIDLNINQIVKSVDDGNTDIKDVFNNIKTIRVEETYPDAREELDGLFINAIDLLSYEDTPFVNDYKVGRRFFEKISVIEYDSDDDF